jgi:hypothetical protein
MRKAVYECVQQRIESSIQSEAVVLNWDVIVENQRTSQTDQDQEVASPEMPTTPTIDLGHLPQNFSINQGEGVPASDGSSETEGAIGLQGVVSSISEEVETSSENWKETIKAYGQLLVEGFGYGLEAIKDLLMPWTTEQRWGAFIEFERLAPEKMERLAVIEPSWYEWCDV